jgi:tRNA1(Val) A37 N6-methylase TrmN6
MSIYSIVDFTALKQTYTVSPADKLEYGEICTPFSLITQMLNLFPPLAFSDPHKTWFDVGAGQGYFSLLIFERLNLGLVELFPDETERKTHIVEKMLYMLELKETNVAALRVLFGEKANIICADFCEYDSATDKHGTDKHGTYNKYFDYIIGNPPYNAHGLKKVPTKKDTDKKNDGTTLWTKFISKSLTLLQPQTGQLCMIVPALWLKPDKSHTYARLTRYKLEKIHCFSSNATNTLFKGEAQTPTCFFLLTNTPAVPDEKNMNNISLYDTQRGAYVDFPHQNGKPLPLFGAHIIKKLQPWLVKPLRVFKTNMPSKKSQFTDAMYKYPYTNITTCVLEGLQPVLLLNYSDIPQPFHGMKKLVLAHKMYGFPYWDKHGHYGIANRDNYVVLDKTDAEFAQLAAFLSTKFALYLFEATRYRMRYLERYAFEFIPDITCLDGFPSAKEISDETVADFFGLDMEERSYILSLHKKNYKRFI